MVAEIITIGDEILIGQIVDTNSAYISKQFDQIGVVVERIVSIADTQEAIETAMREAEARADVIVLTGGLGPTRDDVTKHTFCAYFGDVLVENAAVLTHIEHLFKTYVKRPLTSLNIKQALVPSKAMILKNNFGTAPGMWMSKGKKAFISLPGVPVEMKGIIMNEVIPRLAKIKNLPVILHQTILTYGLGETRVAERIEAWEDALPTGVKLAYLPNFGFLRLRLSVKGTIRAEVEALLTQKTNELIEQVKDIFVGYDTDGEIETSVATLLRDAHKTLALAESCTGGAIAQRLTKHPGASDFFKGGVVAYNATIKEKVLGVDPTLIATHSVVSHEVAEGMAQGVRKAFDVDYGVAVTGNAGPTVDGETKTEVGEVFLSVASPTGVVTERFNFGKPREKVIERSTVKALEMLRKVLIENQK